jgi:hypothetical protein
MSAAKEKYEVSGKRHTSFKDAAAKAIDLALESRESVAISVIERERLVAYINIEATLERI